MCMRACWNSLNVKLSGLIVFGVKFQMYCGAGECLLTSFRFEGNVYMTTWTKCCFPQLLFRFISFLHSILLPLLHKSTTQGKNNVISAQPSDINYTLVRQLI